MTANRKAWAVVALVLCAIALSGCSAVESAWRGCNGEFFKGTANERWCADQAFKRRAYVQH